MAITSEGEPSYEQAKPTPATRGNQNPGEKKKRQQKRLRQQQREAGLTPPTSPSAPNRTSPFESIEQESAARQEAVSGLIQIMRQLLPVLLGRLGKIPDPRNPQKLKHRLTVLMVYGLLTFVFQYACLVFKTRIMGLEEAIIIRHEIDDLRIVVFAINHLEVTARSSSLFRYAGTSRFEDS